jgi:3-methyladenine DNA glycosylase AlkC
MAEKFLLKDLLFNQAKVEQLAGEIQRVYSSFNTAEFVREVVAKFPELELKARITWIAERLKHFLPEDYEQAVRLMLRALPPPNNPELSDGDFGDFIYAPYGEYVARYGCTEKHLHFSLEALREITQRFSAEDAIRYFINAFPQETLHALRKWSKASHYHVRRLASEGTRPKLPWSQKINIPITAPLPILDNLFFDRTRFVTRSVANHINDISKIDPELALNTLARWKKSPQQKPEEMDYLIRHALRTLVKQGNPKALRMLGFSHAPQVRVSKFRAPKAVKMNTALEFSFTITSRADANVIIDYILYFQNKAGKLNSKKVFKLAKLALAKNQPALVSKRHMLRERMTTRTLYPGKHEIEIQVNGKKMAKKAFVLKQGDTR